MWGIRKMLLKYKWLAINVSFSLILALFTWRLFTTKDVGLTLLPSPPFCCSFGILHSVCLRLASHRAEMPLGWMFSGHNVLHCTTLPSCLVWGESVRTEGSVASSLRGSSQTSTFFFYWQLVLLTQHWENTGTVPNATNYKSLMFTLCVIFE